MTEDELEILEEFIQESREHLAAIEPDLLEMERQGSGTTSEIVNRVFRAIHSIKGGAAFLAFESLKDFSHVMENVLMHVRDGKLDISAEVIDVLLKGVDVLRRMVDDVRESSSVDCARERALLGAVLQAPPRSCPIPGLEPKPDAHADVADTLDRVGYVESGESSPAVVVQEAGGHGQEDRGRELRAHGKRIYRVVARAEPDLFDARKSPEEVEAALSSIGQIIERPAAYAVDVKSRPFEWQVASVLEVRLLAAATGLPTRCFVPVDDGAGRKAEWASLSAAATVSEEPEGKLETPSEGVATTSDTAVPVASASGMPIPNTAMTAGGAVQKEKLASKTLPKEQASEGNETLRVRVELLNRLMDSASELVLGRNQLLRALKEQADKSTGLGTILQHIDRVTTDLQEGIMQTRMQQIGSLFGRYARVARDLGRQLGKDVELRAEGNHVELDKSIIEALADPLTHIVRNAVDHAIEVPEERRKRRKPAVGKILLSASHESGQVKIVIEDDGRGIDRARVLRKALEKGLIAPSAAEKATGRDIVNLLTTPGFSTADQISDVSGRGVGMDVVRSNVEALGGQIEIDSEPGMGTSVQLRLPLTLAIIPSLIVGAAGARFAVPQASIVELVWVRADDAKERIQYLQGASTLRLRERLVPLVKVQDVLGLAGGEATSHRATEVGAGKDQYILLLRAGTEQYGLVVDELFESEEIVVKPLPLFLKGIECFAGTTILGDGSVTMILDPSGVAVRAGLKFASAGSAAMDANGTGPQGATSKRSVILFAGSPEEQYMVPQDQVLRLERLQREDLQRAGGKDFVCYRGVGLPLVRLEQHLPVGCVPDCADELFVIIPRMGGRYATEPTAGILVWRILDALDVELELQTALFDGPGVCGSMLLDGVLSTLLDPVALVEVAQPRKERAA